MFERGQEAGLVKREDECSMGPCRRAALSSMEEGGQALGLDIQMVSREDSFCNAQALEYISFQKRVEFHPRVDKPAQALPQKNLMQ